MQTPHSQRLNAQVTDPGIPVGWCRSRSGEGQTPCDPQQTHSVCHLHTVNVVVVGIHLRFTGTQVCTIFVRLG